MAKNTVERTEGCHVVSFLADGHWAIPKGSALVLTDDYTVAPYSDQSTFAMGVALEESSITDIHASGCVPVLLPGPVLRVTIGTGGCTFGQKVTGDAVTPGEWVVDANNPAGFALETGSDGDEVDICFVGEQY